VLNKIFFAISRYDARCRDIAISWNIAAAITAPADIRYIGNVSVSAIFHVLLPIMRADMLIYFTFFAVMKQRKTTYLSPKRGESLARLCFRFRSFGCLLNLDRIYTSPIYYRIEHSALFKYFIRWCPVLSSMFGSVETGEFYYKYTSRFIAVLNIL